MTAPCDDCGKPVRVPETHAVDWAYCANCHDSGQQWPALPA